MRTSSERSRVIRRRLLVCAAFAVCAVAVNALLTFVLVPYGSKSEVAWQDYAQEENIDCVVVGTSSAMRGVDPRVLDEELGTNSFNLATPSQLLDESFVAVKTAYEDHGISRVILCLSHSQAMRSSAPNPGSPFMYERSRVVSPEQQMEGLGYLLFDCGAISTPQSLNVLFPWASSMVSESFGAIVKNATMKVDGTTLYEASSVNEPGLTYCGKGFQTKYKKLDYNSDDAQSFFAQERRDDLGVDASRAGTIDPSRKKVLEDLTSFCSDHGIELFVVAPPLAAFNIIEYGDSYFTMNNELESFFEARGARYVDINLARRGLFRARERYFADPEHLNFKGARAFSRAVARVVRMEEAGEDVGALLMTGEEYLASVGRVSCVFVDAESWEDGVHLLARAMAGTGVEVEYQFCVRSGEEWEVVRDWSADPALTYLPPGGRRGEVRLRVNARKAGSDADWDRCRRLTAMY